MQSRNRRSGEIHLSLCFSPCLSASVVQRSCQIPVHCAFTVTEALVFSHAMIRSAALVPLPFRSMVNCSTGAAGFETFISMRARSWVWSYSVPHWPVCLLMISFQPVSEGSVYSVYLPAGTFVSPTVTSPSVTNVVASLAPVRHTCPKGTSPPMIFLPRVDGRLYSIVTFLPPSEIEAVPGGLGRLLLSSCCCAMAVVASASARNEIAIPDNCLLRMECTSFLNH